VGFAVQKLAQVEGSVQVAQEGSAGTAAQKPEHWASLR
jgi:hypothetical protein